MSTQTVGVEVGMETIRDIFNESRSGGFFSIRRYEPEGGHGEIATYNCQFGVNYGNIKALDIADLDAILDGTKPISLTVRYGTHVDANGVQHSRKAKDRTPMTVTLSLDMTDSRLQQAVRDVRQSLINPRPATAEYDRWAKGGYALLGEGENGDRLYIRDCLINGKEVHVRGDYPFKASSPDVAIRDAVRRTLRTGRYRQFILDGRFESISISGESISQNGEFSLNVPADAVEAVIGEF